jgi:hypothetical protein
MACHSKTRVFYILNNFCFENTKQCIPLCVPNTTAVTRRGNCQKGMGHAILKTSVICMLGVFCPLILSNAVGIGHQAACALQ